MDILLTSDCSDDDVAYLRRKLIDFNMKNICKEPIIDHVRHTLRNENNQIVGGISGIIYMDCLTIDLLWVSDELRGLGYGKRLLFESENIAKARNCKMVLLDTFSFQAPEFYKRNGYVAYATLENCPIQNVERYYFKKDI